MNATLRPDPVAATLRSVADLREAGLVAPDQAADLDAVASRYAIAVTPDMAALIDRSDPHDPIARQFVPRPEELDTAAHELPDPIGDAAHSPLPGLVHRYPDRVLFKLLHACPVYCRFCFRREMVGPGGDTLTGEALERALAYVRARPGIFEVVLTGGDPLMLAPRRMAAVISALAAIPHVAVIRLHTRVPVVDPGRVDEAMAAALDAGDKTLCVAIHANHPREFTPAARTALNRLHKAGAMLVSQSVLLRGVNDDPATLEALMRAFLAHRVKPYYLHQGDLAPGTAHFRTTIAEGQALMRALRGRLSGLAQPTYVLDIPGGHGKVPVGPDWIDADLATVTDPSGRRHVLFVEDAP